MKSVVAMILPALLAARSAGAFAPRTVRAFSRTSATKMAANPKVFFDMEVGGEDMGRVTFELRADVVPKTGAFVLVKWFIRGQIAWRY